MNSGDNAVVKESRIEEKPESLQRLRRLAEEMRNHIFVQFFLNTAVVICKLGSLLCFTFTSCF